MTTTTFDAHPRSSLIVALDFDSLSTALKFAQQVADLVGMFKIGNQLFTAAGPAAVKEVARATGRLLQSLAPPRPRSLVNESPREDAASSQT